MQGHDSESGLHMPPLLSSRAEDVRANDVEDIPKDVPEHSERAEDTKSPPQPVVPARSRFKSVCLVATCTGALIVNSANNTSVSIALPTIGRSLHIPVSNLQWIVSAYSLSSGCLLLVFGRLADLYGRKRVFILSALWLMAFSLACAFAKDETTLEILRGFQGVGGSAMMPAVVGVLAHAFPPSRAQGIAFATFSSGAPIGAAFGMVLGGLLTELSSKTWRSVFYLSTGLTFLCLIGGILTFDSDPPLSTEVDRRVDWLGAALISTSLILIVFVLGEGEITRNQWRTPYIIALLLAGILLLLLFLVWQYYLERVQREEDTDDSAFPHVHPHLHMHMRQSKFLHPPPLMKLSLWSRANGRFAVVCVVAFLQYSAFISWNFWVQLYYQIYAHLPPLPTVARLLPMFVTGGICNLIMALLIDKVPFIIIVASGTLSTTLAALLFALIQPSATYWAYGFPAAVLSVIGADFVFAAGSIFVARCAEPEEQSLAGAVFQTMIQIGTAFGVTITSVVFDRVSRSSRGPPGPPHSPPGPPTPDNNMPMPPLGRPGGPSPLVAYQAAQWTAFGLGCAATVLALVFLRGVGVVGHPGGPEGEGGVREEKEGEGEGEGEGEDMYDGELGVRHVDAAGVSKDEEKEEKLA